MTLKEAAWGAILEQARNILVRPDELTDQATSCNKLFEATPSPRAVIVSYEQSVEDWLTDTQRSSLDSMAFVSVGETVRSTATTTPAETAAPPGPDRRVRINGVGDPTNLAALGLTIHAQLKAYAESGEVVVCFDSLSALVDAVSLRQAFRFLHLLTTLTRAYDATAHYHYDDRLPTEDLETLRPLFDAEFGPEDSHDPAAWSLASTADPSASE